MNGRPDGSIFFAGRPSHSEKIAVFQDFLKNKSPQVFEGQTPKADQLVMRPGAKEEARQTYIISASQGQAEELGRFP
jgi:hypothetical protein